jgi:hypothetical protein
MGASPAGGDSEAPGGNVASPLAALGGDQPAPAELRAYQPSLRERIANGLQDMLMAAGADAYQSGHYARGLTDIVGLTPLGIPFAVNEMRRAAEANNPVGVVTSAIGALPAPRGIGRLAMDEASRMARARTLGYADEPFYRGESSGLARPSIRKGHILRATRKPRMALRTRAARPRLANSGCALTRPSASNSP